MVEAAPYVVSVTLSGLNVTLIGAACVTMMAMLELIVFVPSEAVTK
jgi:hypothetical protein